MEGLGRIFRSSSKSLHSPKCYLFLSNPEFFRREHLYRAHHIQFQCQRCKIKLNSIKELDGHVEANLVCFPRARQAKDGFSSEVWRVLHSKKKSYAGQTEEDKWIEIYQLLFPFAKSIPSPCKSYPLQRNTWTEFQAVCESSDLHQTLSSKNDFTSFDEIGCMALPEDYRRRISTQVKSTVQAFETQLFEQVSSIARESGEHMAANRPEFQDANYPDFFVMTDLQSTLADPAYGMQDVYSPSGDRTPRMQDSFSSIPSDQFDFGFLPHFWNSPNEKHPPTTNPPITPSPSHSGGPPAENILPSTLSKDTDVMKLLETIRKNMLALEKRIQGSDSLT